MQYYSEELLKGLEDLSRVAAARAHLTGPPSAADAWKDVKMNGGRREYRRLFRAVTLLSERRATAESIHTAQEAERRIRSSKALAEDGKE